MKKALQLALFAAAALPLSAQVPQDVDRTKYPDYSVPKDADQSLLKYGSSRSRKGRKTVPVTARPDHVNNASTKHFPPIFNQDGGSCGSASRIRYMFSHEMNSYRDTDGSLLANNYPTHFVWLHTYGNSSKDDFVTSIGVPSAKTYGGATYSKLFGYQEWKDTDYGWMTGYEKWFEAMHNRMLRPTSIPGGGSTPESIEAAKNWLWNHNGDPDFHSGGLIGIGVASAVIQGNIPSTDANSTAGVVGQKYVKFWGTGVDHALTIVGYDDRIEFDLDENGIAGEKDKNEVGAWIIANSWGAWANNGLIYCPYAYSCPQHDRLDKDKPLDDVKNRRPSGGWNFEIYKVRKDYRPLRTIKVKMDYSHRSEIKLKVGVSSDLNAKTPAKEIELEYFRFAGDGAEGSISPAPAVPMLGKWADGKLHDEPMEFGYDLTDLTADFDNSKPLKYFFTIDSRTKSGVASKAVGSGHVYAASILNYEYDRKGTESFFDLGANSVVDVPKGRVTTISVVAYGEQYGTPQNLVSKDNVLSWSAPQASGHNVTGYKVYLNGKLLAETTNTKHAITESGTYAVSAVYEGNVESQKVSVASAIEVQTNNVAINLKNNGFVIPGIFNNKFKNATIEYWIKPNSLKNWNQALGPGWGSFMSHTDATGQVCSGWAANERAYAGEKLAVGKWSHVATVVQGNSMRVYVNDKSGVFTSQNNSGIGGFGDLVFSNSSNNNSAQDAVYDEIRIWDAARTSSIISAKNVEFSGDILPAGLLAYYKGDIIMIDGKPHLRDCVGGHHAPLLDTNVNNYEQVTNDMKFETSVSGNLTSGNCKITGAAKTKVGQPLALTASYPDAATNLVWNAPEAGVKDFRSTQVSLTFPKAGEYEVKLKVSNTTGDKSIEVTKKITVEAAEAPNAEFTFSQAEVPAGERVSLTPTNPIPGYIYEWTMPGAETTSSNSITATTSYNSFGTYDVTLSVTSPDGQKATKTQKLLVKQVAPKADFIVEDGIVVLGEKAVIADASKFDPRTWKWLLSSPSNSYMMEGKACIVNIDKPGVYDVTLKVTNAAGESKKTQNRGLIVVNADSKNGLAFTNDESRLTAQRSPIKEGDNLITIEWWMNPSKLADYCCGIGDNDANFMMKVGANGQLIVSRSGKQVSSGAGAVIAGAWHHYAVVFNKGYIYMYRDGENIASRPIASMKFPAISKFVLGSDAAVLRGQVDEFRVWGSAFTKERIRQAAMEPVADVAAAEASADKLLLYYDFNQSSGDVADRTSNGNTGARTGFGPDGDAWALSKGVFSLSFDKSEDVTSAYLKNYKPNFVSTNKQVNPSTANRFYELKDWILENTATSADGKTIAGAHLDKQKKCFTITTGWDGFPNLADHKAYQVMTLPAGVYTLTTTFTPESGLGNSNLSSSYLVAAAGTTLPVRANLNTALGYQEMANTGAGAVNSLRFVLTEETEVAVGLLVNMSGQNIAMIKEFNLTRSELTNLTPTSIDAVVAPNAIGSQQLYDLSGHRVTTPVRGEVYIQNGKRILVK